MKRYVLILVILVLIIGCGEFDPRKPVYNMADNPDNFPAMAINLLQGLENGSIVGYDTIIIAFADLYTQQGQLLDNDKWADIVRKLGLKFKYNAEQEVLRGIENYYQAAEWYGLASFALPEDKTVKTLNNLFSLWKKDVDDSMIAVDFNTPGREHNFTEQLDLLRYYYFNDSLHRELGRQYLFPSILGRYTKENPLAQTITDSLSVPDKAFLSYLGLYDKPIEDKFIYYTEPEINLVTCQIRPQGDDWFRIEIYFLPKDTVTVDYTIALRGNIAGEVPNLGDQGRNIMPFDFAPEIPSTQWTKNKIALAYHKFYYPGVKGLFSVGLYIKEAGHFKYNPVWRSGFNFYTLPDTVLKVY